MEAGISARRVSELLRSPGDFDLFSGGAPPDERLLRARLHPPLPVWRQEPPAPADGPGRETVVWGWPLLRRLQAAGVDEAPVVEHLGDGGEALALALRIEGRAGGYRWSELRAIGACIRSLGLQDRERELSPLVLGRPGSLQRELSRFEALTGPLRALVETGAVDLKTAERAGGVPESVAAAFAERAEDLSFSQRRVILELLNELSVLGRRPADEIIERLREAFESGDPPAALRAVRFPRLHDLERRFGRFRERYLGGSGVELHPPPYFEGEAYSVRFRFESASQLARRLEALRALERHCDELFRLL